MLEAFRWEPVAKTSYSRQQQEADAQFLWNVSQGIELPYTATMNKRKRTQEAKESQLSLLSKIEPSPL